MKDEEERGVYIWLKEQLNSTFTRAATKLPPPFTVSEVRAAMRKPGGLNRLYVKVRHYGIR